MPRKAEPIIGNPNDPKGMIVLMEEYLEWRQVRNFAERTIGVQRDRNVSMGLRQLRYEISVAR